LSWQFITLFMLNKKDKAHQLQTGGSGGEVKVAELQKLSGLFNMTIDQLVNFEGDMPEEITVEDKSAVEQIKLISKLDDDDKKTVFSIIDKMLTNKKFKTFFQENIDK